MVRAYQTLGSLQRVWSPVFGAALGAHWLDADALTRPATGKLKALLDAIAREVGTEQRKIIAAAFALRFGAAGSTAIGPFMVSDCVPDVSLGNIALRFGPNALLERVALRSCRDTTLTGSHALGTASDSTLPHTALLDVLRTSLCDQAEPVLVALSGWSKLSVSVLWGLVLSAWGNEFVKIGNALGCPERALDAIALFLETSHPAFVRRPHFYVTKVGDGERICQVRGSCCLNYRIGANAYCVSCPLRSKFSLVRVPVPVREIRQASEGLADSTGMISDRVRARARVRSRP